MAQGRGSTQGTNQAYSADMLQITNALAGYIAQNKRDIDQNITNLIQIGKDNTKIGKDTTYFGEKVTELDKTNQAQYENIIGMGDIT